MTPRQKTRGKVEEAAFYFVKDLAWLIDSYTVEKADTTSKSLVDLIEAVIIWNGRPK